jgi:hypothetical protein
MDSKGPLLVVSAAAMLVQAYPPVHAGGRFARDREPKTAPSPPEAMSRGASPNKKGRVELFDAGGRSLGWGKERKWGHLPIRPTASDEHA